MDRTTRRRFIVAGGGAATVAIAGCTGDEAAQDDVGTPPPDADDEADDAVDDETATPEPYEATHEIWAADQGTDTIYIYEPADEAGEEFDLLGEIDTAQDGGEVPHMIHFSSDYEYAAVACTAGARTLVYRTEDRELVGNVETGAGSHFAGFTPDDDAVVVDVIGESEIVRVDADLEAETFEVDDRIEVGPEIDGLTEEEGAPICHSYDHQGRSIHTLGPAHGDAGVVIVDHDDFAVVRAWPGDELPTNCGTVPHPTEDKFYLTAGRPSDPEEDVEGLGEFYVLDTADDEILVDGMSTGGVDAHGFWFTPDGEELWVLNRETNDGVVLDPETDEVVEEIDAFGPADDDDPEESDAPDIMWATPDGEYVVVTLRGPAPLSGDPHAATGVTPGFSVLDVETKEIVGVVEPDPIDDYDEEDIEAAREEDDDAPAIPDFHGIGVRPIDDFDTAIDTSPPY